MFVSYLSIMLNIPVPSLHYYLQVVSHSLLAPPSAWDPQQTVSPSQLVITMPLNWGNVDKKELIMQKLLALYIIVPPFYQPKMPPCA
jgi:hypothetical protein